MKLLLALVLVSGSASAATHKFNCFGYGESKGARLSIVVTEATLKVEGVGTAKRNPAFKPNPKQWGMVEYVGFKGIEPNQRFLISSEMPKGGKDMKDGKRGGFVRLLWPEKNYEGRLDYVCFTPDSK